jgi:hypothetical protein
VCVFIYARMYIMLYDKCPAAFHVVTVETSIKGVNIILASVTLNSV